MKTIGPYLKLSLAVILIVWLVVGVAGYTDVKLKVLWTDGLVYLLVVALLLFTIQAKSKEHLRGPWRHIARRRIAMSAMVVLMFYVAVGLLDSVHFRKALERQPGQTQVHYSGEVLSLLDIIATALRERQETTYSAPFATHAYMKEMLDVDGRQIRDYPRLTYGGAHLENSGDKGVDIAVNSGVALLEALLASAFFFYILSVILARNHKSALREQAIQIIRFRTEMPWMIMFITFTVLLVCVFLIINLSGKYHVFGTDKVGQDVLYLALKSIRTGLVIGTLTTLIMLPFAVMLGIMAGYFRGWVDDVIQYVYTTLNSIPGVLLIAAAVLSLQVYMENHPELFETLIDRTDMRLLFLCIILGITSWTGLCRLLRGETLKVSQVDYVEAATAFGVRHFNIMTRHILPNVMHIVLIAVVIDFSGLVLAEAVLSYIGIGVDPAMISWGNMINSARLEMARDPIVWWSLAAAFVFMFVLVLAANLFSDAVRDAFDPRVSRSQ
ncbi:MAG: ABC transporter permease [Gammaproteobacteria bacterium]|jgi:peptide/nickel transport system permease protein